MKKIEFFKVEGNKIIRNRKHCPKCGPGVFIAEHKDRFSCGKCGYTEFKGGGKKEPTRAPPKPEPSAEIKEEKPLSESTVEPVETPESTVEEPSVQEPQAEASEKPETDEKSSKEDIKNKD